MTRPVRGGLGVVIVLLVIAGAIVLAALAPGGWSALPIVQFFRRLDAFELWVAFLVPVVLVVIAGALLNARKPAGEAPVGTSPWWTWTPRRFAVVLAAPPLFVLAGAWLLRGFDGLVIAGWWKCAYLGVGLLLGACWLISAYHAFRSERRSLLWVLAGAAIAASALTVRAADANFFVEWARCNSEDGIGYLLLGKCTSPASYLKVTTYRVARVRSEWLGLTRYQVLVETNRLFADRGISAESALLVRPEGFHSGRAELFASKDGFVARIRGELYCDAAFDTTTGKGFGEWHDTHDRFGQGMETLSPFRLLEAGGRPDPGDIGILEGMATARARELESRPAAEWPEEYSPFAIQEKPLLAALESRNEFVREAAARIIRAGGKVLYPEAMDRGR